MDSADHPIEGQTKRTVAFLGLNATGSILAAAVRALQPGWHLLGHEPDRKRAEAALRSRVIDQHLPNPVAAARDAGIVFISQSLGQSLATLEQIAPHLQSGAVVTDTGPLKVPVVEHAAQHLPSSVAFVGGHPILGLERGSGAQALSGVTYCLVPARGAGETAVQTIAALVSAMGAEPYFVDAAEHDALVVGAQLMPDLVRSTQLSLLARSPSARDIGRLCPPATAEESQELARWLAEASTDLTAARAATVHWLDRLLAELLHWRQLLDEGNPELIACQATTASQELSSWPGSTSDRQSHQDELHQPGFVRQALFGQRRPPPRPEADR